LNLAVAALILLGAILWTAALGSLLAAPLLRGLHPHEKLAWGFGAGLLFQAAAYVALLALRAFAAPRLEPGPAAMLALGALALVARILASRRRTAPAPPRDAEIAPIRLQPSGFPPVLVEAVATAAVAVFLIGAVSEPLWQNDYLAIWGLKAKTIFFSRAIPGRLFHDPETAWSHPEYPLLLPLALASLSEVAGSWNDHALAIFSPALEAATLLAISGWLRRRSPGPGAGGAVLLTALFFPLYGPPNAGTAEIPFAFALVLLCAAVLDSREKPSGGATSRVAVASLLACGLKQEGTLFVIVLATVSLAAWLLRRRTAPISLCAALLLPAAANALALRLARGSLGDRDFDAAFLRPDHLGQLWGRLVSVYSDVLRVDLLPLAVPVAAAVSLLLLTPRRSSDALLVPLGAQIAVYASVCAFAAYDPLWLARNSFARIAAALFPAFALVLGDRISARLSLPEDGGAAERVS
jgi:hypothetical protein